MLTNHGLEAGARLTLWRDHEAVHLVPGKAEATPDGEHRLIGALRCVGLVDGGPLEAQGRGLTEVGARLGEDPLLGDV